MRFALAALLLAACAPRTTAPKAPADAFGSFLGNYHVSRGPSDPTAPLAMDPDVTEGGGPISMAVPRGPAPGSVVTPTVGEQPDTLEQAKGPVTTPQQPAAVIAPTIPVNPPGTTTTPAPATGTGTGTTTAPVQGPVTGAGPNGPGTGTGPATPTGPATGTNTPTPTNPGPTTSTPPPR